MLNHEEAAELLGAYALDAVEDSEAALIELHLSECPRCRAEVAAHREVAALLGNYGVEAPAELWERIAGGLEGSSPPPVLRALPGSAPVARRRPAWMVAGTMAAAAAAVFAFMVVRVSSLGGQVNDLKAALGQAGSSELAARSLFSSGARRVVMTSVDHRVQLDVAVQADGKAVVVWDNLPVLGRDRTYQLWGLVHQGPVSLGLAGADPRNATFRVDPAVTAIMVTVEPAGGVSSPGDSPVLAQGRLGVL